MRPVLAFSGSAFLAFDIHPRSDRAGGLAEGPAYGVEAHRRIGIREPVVGRVRLCDRDRQVLVLLQMSRERPQGPEHAVLVDDLDLFAQSGPSSPDARWTRAAVE
jgi:hypothetical protein